jgi:hypothetical protein
MLFCLSCLGDTLVSSVFVRPRLSQVMDLLLFLSLSVLLFSLVLTFSQRNTFCWLFGSRPVHAWRNADRITAEYRGHYTKLDTKLILMVPLVGSDFS